ncbi:MAG: chemotaxis protein CheA [Deltaproteobacteria bacterium]|nr:MAG: chemotaxis protein CheA [Deltaproteobacteria bacterium]
MEFSDQIELIKEYIEEATEFLEEFESMLLQLEQMVDQEPDPQLINDVLSLLHTFKGNSGMMGYSSIQKYTHKLEDLFKALQSGTINLNESLAEFSMQSARILENAISKISPESPAGPDLKEDIADVKQFITENVKSGLTSPELRAATPSKESISPFAKKTNVIRVDFERLDHLMNLMGELVISRTRLGQIDTQFKETFGEKGIGLELSSTSEQIGKITTELHEAIMKVRMLPLKQVFMRFPRLVRDLAREKGKEIEIKFEGEDNELDKTVIDEIGEPLMHLIRNAIDHGIENPGDREELGKPRQGMILIRAYQESSHIIITVEDDGRGIDEEQLRKKAGQADLLPKDEIGHRELIDLIFLPGLSTAKTVTEVSGRGLGMDVVKRSLAKINGSVELESERNVGTRFTIKLPLTLAIISALMVEASKEQYAIPLASVVESIKVANEEIHLVNNREVTKFRDYVLPLVRLTDLFGLAHSPNGGSVYTVIVQGTGGQMGIVVDSLRGQQEIVIKALDDYIGDSVGIAGATILGDGRVVLIVDVPALMDRVRTYGNGGESKEAQNA